ncbi:MAG: T9SS type A sorting domain-containing protein [Bacteroidia bacterium]
MLYINADENIEQVQLINNIGELIYIENIKDNFSYTLSLADYSNGVYVITIKIKNSISVSKINIVR